MGETIYRRQLKDLGYWVMPNPIIIRREFKINNKDLVKITGKNKGFYYAGGKISDSVPQPSTYLFFNNTDSKHFLQNYNIKNKGNWEQFEFLAEDLLNLISEYNWSDIKGVDYRHTKSKLGNQLSFFKLSKKSYEEKNINNIYIKSYQVILSYIEYLKDQLKKDSSGYVYFVKAKGKNLIKIGVSKNPPERKLQLETKLPFKLEFIKKIKSENPYKLEKKFHSKFNDKRLNGEWFQLNKKDIEKINIIPAE